SKVVGERLVRERSPSYSWLIVRPTSIWGPWFDVPYKTFFRAVARNRYMHVKGHDVAKSFGFVGNSVHELGRLLTTDDPRAEGATLYLADYPPIRVHDLAERIRSALGARPIGTVRMPVLRPVALAGDVLQKAGWRTPPLPTFSLNT